MNCGKRAYPTRKDAKKAMKDLNHTAFQQTKLTDVYFCKECLCWHTTSMPKKDSRKLKRFRK